MENEESPLWYVAVRQSTACVPLRLSMVCKSYRLQFAEQFEFFWRALLAQNRDLRFRYDEECMVCAPGGIGHVRRACRHSFFDATVAYEREQHTGVHQKIFRCINPGCNLSFESMSSLHTHQATCCIPACDLDAELRCRVEAYTKCSRTGPGLTCLPCEWSAESWRTSGLLAVMADHTLHVAEHHGRYECTEPWCTSALCEGISRLCDMHYSDAVTTSLRLRLCASLERIQAIQCQSYGAADVAALVQQITAELTRVLPDAARFDFLSAAKLRTHNEQMHTSATWLYDVPPGCTLTTLVSEQVSEAHTVTPLVSEQVSEAHTVTPLVSEQVTPRRICYAIGTDVPGPDCVVIQRLQELLRAIHDKKLCNPHGVLLALVVPAHQYQGDALYYVRELVESHSCLYTHWYERYSTVVAEVVSDLNQLHAQVQAPGTDTYEVPIVAICAQRASSGHTSPQWWADEANHALIMQIFRLCVHVHGCIREYFRDTAWSCALRDSHAEPAVGAVHATIRLLQTSRCTKLAHRLRMLAQHTEYPDLASLAGQASRDMYNSPHIEWRTVSAIVTEMNRITPRPPKFKHTRDEVYAAFRDLHHCVIAPTTLHRLLQLPQILQVARIFDPVKGDCLEIGMRSTGDVTHASVSVLSKYEQLTTHRQQPVNYRESLQFLAETVLNAYQSVNFNTATV